MIKMMMMTYYLLLLLTYIGYVSSQISSIQWKALSNIYQSGHGQWWQWHNNTVAWNFTTINYYIPCHKWQGIRCNNAGTNVISLILSSFNITGFISSSIGNLTSLTILNISNNNNLIGKIPTTIQSLTSLVILDLSNNSLTGLSSLSNLIQLEFLSLSNNMLYSTIPSLIPNNKLQVLLLNNNYFHGNIPLANTNITVYNIGSNNLSSLIPPFTSTGFSFPLMKQFICNNNMIKGPIPSFSNYMKQLELIDLSNNMLTGYLDPYIWQLPALNTLLLSSNQLSGSISSAATQSSLVNLDLSFNRFFGRIPSFIFNSSTLQKLAMVSNCFSGSTIPQTICSATSLVSLALDGLANSPYCNSIGHYGPISVLYSSLFQKLQGSIPSCVFTNLLSLQSLHLVGNGLTGTIADIDTNKSNLKFLYLANNRLSGTIPLSIQSYANFIDIDLSNNKIYGNIEQFVTGSNISSISLQVNRLSGNIPKDMDNVPIVNIIDGNLFGCKKLSDLSSDTSAKSYFCSSELFLTSLVIWAVLFFSGFGFIIWLYVSRDPEHDKYKGYRGKILTYCSNKVIHPQVVISISKFFSLSEIWLQRKEMIKESYYGLQKTSFILEEKSVMYNAYKYLEVQDNVQNAILFVLIASFVLFLPTYLWFKGKGPTFAQFSTFEYQYLFITTSAYIHGYKPSSTIFAFLTCILLVSGVIIFRKKYYIKEKIVVDSNPFKLSGKFNSILSPFGNQTTSTRDSIRSTISWARESVVSLLENNKQRSRLNAEELLFSANKRRLIIFSRVCCEYLIQFTNIFFSFGINAAYVYMSSYSGQYYSTRTIYTIQIMVACSKVLLSEIIVPNLCTLLKYAYAHLDNDHVQQHALFMNLINFIFAPVLATIVVSKSCLYYTYHSYTSSSLTLSFNVPTCSSETIIVNGTSVPLEFCSSLNSNYAYEIVPNYYYTYQCGSAVLIQYLSPLVFVYIINGLLFPLFTFLILILKEETLEKFPFRLLPYIVSTSYIKPNYVVSKQIVSNGDTLNPINRDDQSVMARRLSDRKEMINALFQPSQILQKYVAIPLTLMLTFGISSPLLGLTILVAILNQTFVSNFMIGKYLLFALKGESADTIEINIVYAINSLTNIIREEDVRTLKSCWLIILFFISIYWSFMFFDMVGDKWGIKHAAIVSSLLATIYPAIIFLSRNLLQPFYDFTYSKIELQDPKDFQIRIDKSKYSAVVDRNSTMPHADRNSTMPHVDRNSTAPHHHHVNIDRNSTAPHHHHVNIDRNSSVPHHHHVNVDRNSNVPHVNISDSDL